MSTFDSITRTASFLSGENGIVIADADGTQYETIPFDGEGFESVTDLEQAIEAAIERSNDHTTTDVVGEWVNGGLYEITVREC